MNGNERNGGDETPPPRANEDRPANASLSRAPNGTILEPSDGGIGKNMGGT